MLTSKIAGYLVAVGCRWITLGYDRGTYSAGEIVHMDARTNNTRLRGIRNGFAALGERMDWLQVPKQPPAKRKKK